MQMRINGCINKLLRLVISWCFKLTTTSGRNFVFSICFGWIQELPETMMHIATRISAELSRLNRSGRLRQRRRNSKMSNVNKVLLTFMWLRKYPCLDTLALMFDISSSTVCSIIYKVVPILWRYFRNQVSRPNLAEWNSLRGNWSYFPNAVGCIDGTPHEIYRPQVEPQRDFFSGHRHCHIMNTQLIVDNVGNIVFLEAGFLGSLNDAGNWRELDQVQITICL